MTEPLSYYELTRLLGEGGMGRVFQGVHRPSGRTVAIKVLRSAYRFDTTRRRLLLNEATVAARLRHRNVVELLDLGRDEAGTPFLVMELVDGPDLEAWRDEWPGWGAVARAFDDALAGLVAAHAKGILHRDLKPANLLRGEHVKIADFGVAQVQDPLHTGGDDFGPVGTPTFMAPEQLESTARVGPWTDLYAIGVILCELVTGRSAFPATSVADVVAQKLGGAVPDVAPRAGLRLPQELLGLIRSLLHPDPRGRPRFAAAVRARLAELSARVVDEVPRAAPKVERGGVDAALDGTVATGGESLRLPNTVAGVGPDPEATEPTELLSRDEDTRVDTVGAGGSAQVRPKSSVPALPARMPAGRGSTPGAALMRLREPELAGRAAECEALLRLVEETVERGGARMLVLLGPAGVGKSHIARWGLSEVERRACMEGIAAGYDVTGADLRGGLRHALRRLLGLPLGAPTDAEGAMPAAWRWLLRGDEPAPFDPVRVFRWIRAGTVTTLVPPDHAAMLAHGVIVAASRVRPVYLWLDDIGWSTDGALDLVESLLRRQDAAVLVVATLRTGTAQHPGLRARFEALFDMDHVKVRTVEPLAATERRALLASMAKLAPDVETAISRAVDGTPLMMIQLMNEWIESGLLRSARDGLRPEQGMSIHDLLSTRPLEMVIGQRVQVFLDSFGERAPDAEGILLRAALLGVRFEERALRASVNEVEPSELVDDVLDRALLHGFVRAEHGDAYVFEHGLVKESLRGRLDSHPARKEILRETAAGLFGVYGRQRGDVLALVATLLREAGDMDAAWDALVAATQDRGLTGDAPAAAQCIATAKRWLEEDRIPETARARARTFELEAFVSWSFLHYEEALEALARAKRIAHELGDDTAHLRCRALEGSTLFYQDRLAEAEQVALECERKVTLGDPEHAEVGARTFQLLANLAAKRWDLERASRNLERMAEFALAAKRQRIVALAWVNQAELEVARGNLDAASAFLEDGRRLAAEIQDDYILSAVAEASARIALYRGDAHRARAELAPRVRRVEAMWERWQRTALRLLQAQIALVLDTPEEAREAIRGFREAFEEVPHDEPQTRHGMQWLADRLESAGEPSLAGEIRVLIESRERVFRLGFEKRG